MYPDSDLNLDSDTDSGSPLAPDLNPDLDSDLDPDSIIDTNTGTYQKYAYVHQICVSKSELK